MKSERFKLFWLNNKKRNLKILIIAVSVLLLVLAAFEGAKVYRWLSDVNQDPGINYDNADETYVEDETDFEAIHEADDPASLDDLLYKWATNGGEKLSSKDVVNVMLFGVDTEDGLMGSGRTDAMMLVSLNKMTEKISIISFMRDSYTYMDINGKKRFFKINAAYGWGGPATVVKIIEDNYKIAIQNYVCVDFATFPKIIDSLGGVAVEVLPYEASYIRSTSGYNLYPGESVVLDGKTALAFSRARQCDPDGDVSRTRRQRSVIMAMIESVRDATNNQVDSALDFIFPNIKTNYSRSEILTLGTQALVQDWAEFEIIQITSPGEAYRASATINTNFVWVIDYPLEAYAIQNALYGTSNIVLEADRVSALNMLKPKSTSSTTKNAAGTTGDTGTSGTQADSGSTAAASSEPSSAKETSTVENTAG